MVVLLCLGRGGMLLLDGVSVLLACCLVGFPLLEGDFADWALLDVDPVTGLGTPDFEALLKVAAPAAKNEGRKSYPPQCSPTEAGSAAGGP